MSKDAEPKLILDAIDQAISRELDKVYEEEKTRLIGRQACLRGSLDNQPPK